MSETVAIPRLPRERVAALAAAWEATRVVVLGDVMSDHYLWGTVHRMSPEAPVPVVEVAAESTRPGGAANVARTLRALGVRVSLLGVVGADAAADVFRTELAAAGVDADGLIVDPGRPTTVKSAHGLVLSDYAKGVLSGDVVTAAMQAAAARGVPVFVDPKEARLLFEFRGAEIVSLNESRAAQVGGRPVTDDSVEEIGWALRERIGCRCLLITRGPRGLCLLDDEGRARHIGTVARKVFDVTGAGDTVVATVAAVRAAGGSAYEAAVMANHAAGLVVAEVGTAAPARDALLAACAQGERAHDGAAAEQGALADYFRKVQSS